MKKMPALTQYAVMLGCDPEFFFERDGVIIGSENVIDIKEGFKPSGGDTNKFIVDGVQAELNPNASTCREVMARNISYCFKELHKKIKSDPTLKVNFKPTVTVTKTELDKLDKKSRVFGCSPSLSATSKKGKSKIKVDPKKYLCRSAGGHIHLGRYARQEVSKTQKDAYGEYRIVTSILKEFENPKLLVDVLDVFVGNTCVLIDRDPGNKTRRKVYGKAGEYRLPKHGLEYRTLSNFWLKSYPLMSLVFGLCRQAVSILSNETDEHNYAKELLSLVDIKMIRKAINTNNYDLALANFNLIKPFIKEYFKTDAGGYITSINDKNLELFDYFVSKGVDYWFKEDAFSHWVGIERIGSNGFETFLANTVKADMDQGSITPPAVTATLVEIPF